MSPVVVDVDGTIVIGEKILTKQAQYPGVAAALHGRPGPDNRDLLHDPEQQIPPRCSGSQHLEDAVEDTTVICPRNATRLVGYHRLDGDSLIVGELVVRNSSRRFRSLKHRRLIRRPLLTLALFRRFRRKWTSTWLRSAAESFETN
jgi:hypothetical protein